MWLTYTWVLVVALAAADDHWLTYEDHWTTDPVTGKQYKRHSVPSILTRARFQAACHKIGGVLPEPKNKQENAFLTQMRRGLRILPWLGMTRLDGGWKWERDGSRVEWSNWHPQLKTKQNQNCVWMKDDGTWSDLMCDYTGIQSFICEKASTIKQGTTAKPGICTTCHSDNPYLPVCASNGYTYPHRCDLDTWNCMNNQQITAFYEGECAPQNVCNKCPKNKPKAPVCGSNGYSYYHICVLKAWNCLRNQHIKLLHEGECRPHKPVPKPEYSTKSADVVSTREPVQNTEPTTKSVGVISTRGPGLLRDDRWTTDYKTGIEYIRILTTSKKVKKSTMQNACIHIGGFLPEPKSQAENDALRRMICDFCAPTMLGLRKNNDGIWKWDRDGSELVGWNSWKNVTQPQHCAMSSSAGEWIDISCRTTATLFICEKGSTKKPALDPEKLDGVQVGFGDPGLQRDDGWTTDNKTGIGYMRVVTTNHEVFRSTMQGTCISAGGFLPEPQSEAENDALKRMARQKSVSPMLGLRKNADHEWKWDRDGSQVGWFNWHSGFDQYRDSCVVLGSTFWSDMYCYTKYNRFLCEKGSTEKPAPEWKTDPRTGKQYIDLKKRANQKGGQQQACIHIGAFLPQPMDKEENDFLKSMTTKDYRLGMSYITAQKVWRFTYGGANVNYTNWINSSTTPSGEKICASMVTSMTDGRLKYWNIVDCKSSYGTATVVCEKDPDVTESGQEGIERAESGTDGKLQPPALVMSVALGLCRLTHYM